MKSLWNKSKELFMWVVGAIGLLLAIFKLKDKYDSALTKSKQTDALVKDAALNAKKEQVDKELKDLESDKKKALSDAEANSSDKDIEDFFNGRRKGKS